MCKFVFISILNSAFLKMSFRIRSVFCLDVFVKSTSPSSLYKRVNCLSSLFDNEDNIWMPTSLQILAQSKLHMVTSKQLSVFFFLQGSLLLYNKDFLQCFIIRKSFLEYECIAGQTGLHCLMFSPDIDG